MRGTFSVKALVDLGPPFPPMKSALMMTVVKDCTLVRAVWQSQKSDWGRVGAFFLRWVWGRRTLPSGLTHFRCR